MPFTLAHPAAALLLRRTPLPLTAVVAGAMAPDVPVFLDAYGDPYDLTHSLLGIVTVDLVVAVAAVALWFSFLRDPAVDVLPAAVRERLAPHARYAPSQWLLVPAAAVAGSLTHVGWDLFTHHDRWGVDQVGWLHERHGELFGYQWAQYGSSVVGLTVCAAWAVLAVRDRPRTPRPPTVPGLGPRSLAVLATTTLAAGLTAGVFAPEPGWKLFVSQTAVVGTIIGATGALVLAAAWHVRRRFLP